MLTYVGDSKVFDPTFLSPRQKKMKDWHVITKSIDLTRIYQFVKISLARFKNEIFLDTFYFSKWTKYKFLHSRGFCSDSTSKLKS